MNVGQATPRSLINGEVERQVTDRLQHSIATAVEERSVHYIQLDTHSVALQKK